MNPSLKQPQKKPPSKSKASKIPINKIAPLAVTVVVISIAVVATVKGNKKPEETSTPTSSIEEIITSEPPKVVVSEVGTELSAITQVPESTFTMNGSELVFGQNVAYEGATQTNSVPVIQVGKQLVVEPITSCAYRINSKTVDISHKSGAMLCVNQSSIDEKTFLGANSSEAENPYANVDAQIEDILTAGGAESISMTTAFIETEAAGRLGVGEVLIDDKPMLMYVIFAYNSKSLYTLIGICSNGDTDYLDRMIQSVKISGGKISYAL